MVGQFTITHDENMYRTQLTEEEQLLIRKHRMNKERKEAQEWQPKTLNAFSDDFKLVWFDKMYKSALDYFQARKEGKFSDDDDTARYTHEAVISLLGADVWKVLNKL